MRTDRISIAQCVRILAAVNRLPVKWVVLTGVVLLAALLWWRGPVRLPESLTENRASVGSARPTIAPATPEAGISADRDESEVERLRALLERPGVRPHEAVLSFKDAAAYRRFLAAAGRRGLKVLARLRQGS